VRPVAHTETLVSRAATVKAWNPTPQRYFIDSMKTELPDPIEPKPHVRSPLLIAAYCTIGVGLILLVLGAGMFWTLGTVGMAVLLALGELVAQLRRR
jgi:hypothetical protein